MKTEEVDVLQLVATSSTEKWNLWLQKCLANDNLEELLRFRRGIQMGMSTAANKGLVTEKLAVLFCRWTGSIENTIRKIVKRRDRKQNDNVHTAVKTINALADKRERDAALEQFLREQSF
jgi:hypothetical protein